MTFNDLVMALTGRGRSNDDGFDGPAIVAGPFMPLRTSPSGHFGTRMPDLVITGIEERDGQLVLTSELAPGGSRWLAPSAEFERMRALVEADQPDATPRHIPSSPSP